MIEPAVNRGLGWDVLSGVTTSSSPASAGSRASALSDPAPERDDPRLEFEAFYRTGSRDIFRQLYALTSNKDEAQDCLHEAYVRAWQHWSSVRTHDDPQAWVRRVAYRQAISRWRKARNRLKAYERHGAAAPTPALSADAVALERALAQLSAKHREVVVLHYLADQSIEEVAKTVGIPAGTVKTRLMKAREMLRGALDEAADDAGYSTGRAYPGFATPDLPPGATQFAYARGDGRS